VAQCVRSLDYLATHTSLSPIRRGFAPGFVNYKKVSFSIPKVVCHPSMAKTTVMHACILPPFWYGYFSPHYVWYAKPIENET
jgi:hypothetical protein